MNKLKLYRVVEHEDLLEFCVIVEEYLELGWELTGGVFFDGDCYMQAIIKRG